LLVIAIALAPACAGRSVQTTPVAAIDPLAWESARGMARFDRLGGPATARTRWCGEP